VTWSDVWRFLVLASGCAVVLLVCLGGYVFLLKKAMEDKGDKP
jgi:hypothetical protein